MTNTDPKYYQFPHGVQLIDITENLSGNGAQAVQYIARSTRMDGVRKGKTREEVLGEPDSIAELDYAPPCSFLACDQAATSWITFHGCNEGLLCDKHRQVGIAEMNMFVGMGIRLKCVVCAKAFETIESFCTFRSL